MLKRIVVRRVHVLVRIAESELRGVHVEDVLFVPDKSDHLPAGVGYFLFQGLAANKVVVELDHAGPTELYRIPVAQPNVGAHAAGEARDITNATSYLSQELSEALVLAPRVGEVIVGLREAVLGVVQQVGVVAEPADTERLAGL